MELNMNLNGYLNTYFKLADRYQGTLRKSMKTKCSDDLADR